MKTSRFILGLILITITLATYKVVTNPLAQEDIVGIISQSIGGVVGGLIWGLILWFPARLIIGIKNKAPDLRKFCLYTATIMIALFIAFEILSEKTESNSEREEFTTTFNNSCFSHQRQSEENKTLTNSQLQEYCSCLSISISKQITDKEIYGFYTNKTPSSSLQEKIQKSAAECSKEIL